MSVSSGRRTGSTWGEPSTPARVDLHPPGVKVSIFASSVIIARDDVIDHHIEGNNLYGVYSSFTHVIPHAYAGTLSLVASRSRQCAAPGEPRATGISAK